MDPLTVLRKQTEAKQAERAEVVPVATAVPLPAGYASAPAAVAVATTVTAPEKAAPSASAVPAAPAEAVPPPALASFLAPAATVATSSSPGSGASPPRPTFEGTLAGEHVVEQVKSCSLLVQNPFCEVAGRLQMTPYRLKFMIPKGSLRKELQWMREAKYFDVPFGAVESAKEETSTSTAGQTVYKLTITTKDLRVLCFFMPTDAEMRLVSEAVAAFGCPGNPAMLFATKHFEALKKEGALELEVPDSGWCFYDPIQDSARMGIDTELIPNPQCPWRVSELNRHYRLCSSYPSVLVLPRRMPDQALREVAAFRKRGRLPALSWCGGPELGFASLWRCSQTTEGLMGQKCIEDQAMLNAIRLGAGSKDRDLLLIDLRPRMNAWVNKAGGGGFEAYPNCRVIFGGIENIHAVRDAWRAMGAAVRNIVEGQVGSWFKDVANSGWYDYIGAILGSTLKVVEEILNNQANVVIHCSDGWDRTAQVSSLVMLCLDPYYRTQEGFLKLVQKEWCSFGHRFRTRLAIGEQPTAEYSPVFIQWLECVFQLQQQFPDTFEFAPPVLIRLADEVFSNRYGTFFCDNEQERRKVEKQTLSLWTTLLDEREMWRSTSYRPGRTQMLPSLCQANYTIWEAYWFRFHPRGAAAGGEPPSPTKKAEAADPFAPTFLGPASTASATSAPPSLAEPSPVNAEVEAVAAPSPEPSAPAKEGSLFSTAELAAPKKPSPAVALFTDDDEDVFATKPKVPEAEREAAAVRDA